METDFLDILTILAPVFLTVGLGFFLRRIRVLSAEADASIMKLVVNLLYPALLFRLIYDNSALQHLGNVLLAPACGFGLIVAGFGIGLLAGPLFGLKIGKGRRTFALTVGIFNYGYLPIPLVLSLFDTQTAGVLAVFNLGIEIAFWTVGVVLVSGVSLKESVTKIFNGPTIAILLALAANFLIPPESFPGWQHLVESEIQAGWVQKTILLISGAAIPIALILVGATLGDLLPELDIRNSWPTMIGAILLRLGVIPAGMVLLALVLPASLELQRVILVQAAMPAGAFPIIVAKHYGGSPATAVQVVFSTTVLSLLTIPLWLKLGLSLLGNP